MLRAVVSSSSMLVSQPFPWCYSLTEIFSAREFTRCHTAVEKQGTLSLNCRNMAGEVVRKRTISTERPPLVGEGSANFCR
jgi:hypothetical protein